MHDPQIPIHPDTSHAGDIGRTGGAGRLGVTPLTPPPVDTEFSATGEPLVGPPPTLATIGHPVADERDWQYQGTQDGMCGPTSIAMVVNELGLQPDGHELTGADVAQWAIGHGLMNPDGQPDSSSQLGYLMGVGEISSVLLHYGVPNETVSGSLESLEGWLASGREVILAVDGDRIWHDIPASADAGEANHALVLTGIDPQNDTAYVNDPGTPNGSGEAVPLSVLMSAWSTSNYEAVVTDGVPSNQQPTIVDPETSIDSTALPTIPTVYHPGSVIVPLTLDHVVDTLLNAAESPADAIEQETESIAHDIGL
jgi:hypothetical protein